MIIDLAAKVGYGFISMAGSKRITDADLERGEVSPAILATHSVPSGEPALAASVPAGSLRRREQV